ARREPVKAWSERNARPAPATRPIAIPMTTSMHAPYLAPGEPGWGRVVRAGARCSFSTAAPDMLESGACEACASLDGRSTHRRSDFASFALMDDLSGILGSDSETREMQAKCRMKL